MKPAKFVMFKFPFVGRCDRCRHCATLHYCQYPNELTWEAVRGFLCGECSSHYEQAELRWADQKFWFNGVEMKIVDLPIRIVNDGLGAQFIVRSKIPASEQSQFFRMS